MPVDVPSGMHAAGLEPPRVEVDDEPLGPRQRAPAGAGAVADGGDPGAREVAVDGEADGVEGEPAGVRAREDGDADDAPVAAPAVDAARFRQRVARSRDMLSFSFSILLRASLRETKLLSSAKRHSTERLSHLLQQGRVPSHCSSHQHLS